MQNFTVYDRNHKYRKVIGVIGEKCLQLFGHQNNIHHTISLSLSGRTVLEVKAFAPTPPLPSPSLLEQWQDFELSFN